MPAAEATMAEDEGGLRRRKPDAATDDNDNDQDDDDDGGKARPPPPPPPTTTPPTEAKKKGVDGADVVDWHFKRASLFTLVWFVALVALIYAVCPSERIERLEGMEKTAATLAAATLAVSCLSTVYRSFSGIIAATLTVQLCAVITDVLMATAPVPVMIDRVTGARVHMLRWCEFAPLAFLMTLLTEGGDMATDPAGNVRTAYVQSASQGLSTSCGLLFPFMPGIKSWVLCLVVAITLFVPLFYRLDEKLRHVRAMDPKAPHYRRTILCLRLLIVEATVWSLLVAGFLAVNILPAIFSSFPKLQNRSFTMLYDCAMDVIAKVIYMALIVNVHDAMFSEPIRWKRRSAPAAAKLSPEELRMKELRRQMRKQKRLEKERREAEKHAQKGEDAAATTTAAAAAAAAATTAEETRKDQ